MAYDLIKGAELDLHIPERAIIAFKTTVFDLAKLGVFKGGAQETYLDLYNGSGDILLSIMIRRGQNKVFFNDRASKSLVDGWGQTQSVDLNPVDIERWKRSGVTISIHDCSTRSEQRYQILFDLATICYFVKRFPGSAKKVIYSDRFGKSFGERSRCQLSDPLKVSFYELEDLAAVERKSIVSGRVPSAIPDPHPAAISITPSHFIPNQTYASIHWDNGNEIRIYYLERGNILQEYAYSKSMDNGWYPGNLRNLNIILHETSSIAATLHDNTIYIFYQDPMTNFIQMVAQTDPTKEWNTHTPIAQAVASSSIAVVGCFDANGQYVPRVYYQDPELHLREHWFDHSVGQWVIGDLNPGVQPRGTPITAEVVHGGNVDINVMWRDVQGQVVSRSWSKMWGWGGSNHGAHLVDGLG